MALYKCCIIIIIIIIKTEPNCIFLTEPNRTHSEPNPVFFSKDQTEPK